MIADVTAGFASTHASDVFGERLAGLPGDALQFFDRLEFALMPVALRIHFACFADGGGEAAFARRRVVAMLAGEEPARERVVRDHG